MLEYQILKGCQTIIYHAKGGEEMPRERDITNRIFNSEAELQNAVAQWDAQFARRIKKRKFESVNIRSIYRGKFKKESEK